MPPAPPATSAPLYSFSLAELGIMPPVLSDECRQRDCEDCRETFRCDCAHHRRAR